MKHLRTIGLALAAAFCAGQANADGAHGDIEKHQGNRRDHARLSRLVDTVFVSGRQPEADRLCDGHLLQNRRRGEERTQARQARGQAQSGDVIDPHPLTGQRHHRSRMRLDHQQRRAPEAGCLHQHPLPDRKPLSSPKKANKINAIDDLKGKSVVSTAGTTNIKQLNEANAARNLGINIIPAKDHAEAFLMVETDRAVAFVMDDILLASLVAGSKAPGDYVISKDAFSKPEPYGIMLRKDDRGVQEGGRCRHRGALPESRRSEAVRQMVHAENPAEGIEPQRADQRGTEA